MRFRSYIAILFFAVNITVSLKAQEQLGLRIEKYSGLNSVLLNPANGLSSPFNWDVNIVELGIFGETSYGYLRNTNIIQALKNVANIRQGIDFESESQIPPNTLILEYYDNEREKFATGAGTLMGPGVLLNVVEGFSFGLFTRMRYGTSTPHLPGYIELLYL